MSARVRIWIITLLAITTIAAPTTVRAQARLAFGPHAVGFRAICDTADRASSDREQLLVWYPAKRPVSGAALRFSEYVAPSRTLDCGAPASTEAQQRAAVDAFASRIANAAGGPGEPEPIGGRLFPNDSAAGIATRMWATRTKAYLGNEYTRGVLESLVHAERIRVDSRINHANTAGMRRLAYVGDTIASAANDMLGTYVQQFLAYTLQRRAAASTFLDRTAEANGVPAGLLTVHRSRPDARRE